MITLKKYSGLLAAVCILSILLPTLAVRNADFKTCEQSRPCKSNRARAARSSSAEYASAWRSPYRIQERPVWLKDQKSLHAKLVNDLYPHVSFALNATFVEGSEGMMRIKVDQVGGLRQRFNEADRWTLVKQPTLIDQADLHLDIGSERAVVDWGQASKHGHAYRFVLSYDPLLITLYKDNQPHIVLNERGLFNMEHFREKSPKDGEGLNIQEPSAGKVVPPPDDAYPGFKDVDEEGMWEETFGGRTDSKPKGQSLST